MNFRVKMDGCTKQTPFILAQMALADSLLHESDGAGWCG